MLVRSASSRMCWLASLVFSLFLLLAGASTLHAQGSSPKVTITPASGTYTSPSVSNILIKWCSSQPFNDATRQILFNNVDIASSFNTYDTGTQPGCTYSAQSSIGSLTLTQGNEGANRLNGRIENMAGYLGSSYVTYTYQWPGYVPKRAGVSISRVTDAVESNPGAAGAATFVVRNEGSRPASYSLSVTCRGAASGCSPSVTTVSLDTTAAGRQQSPIVYFTGGATPGDTGSITLTARNTTTTTPYNSDRDSTKVDVTIAIATPNKTVPVDIVGGGATMRRDLCLTVSAGPSAASQCGDLRVVHALPSVTTRGATRTPILVYGSNQGPASTLVQADVTPPGGYGALSQVTARVYNAGGAIIGTGSWSGANWGAGAGITRRITVAPSFADYTGVQAYNLEISFAWASSAVTSAAVAGEAATVSRNEQFGRGWGLSGLQRLYILDGLWNLLWVDGDGTAVKYQRDGGSLTFRAVNVDRPDSLIWDGTVYRHWTASGVESHFGPDGLHLRTKPLAGPSTYFTYSGTTLQQITIPSGGPEGSPTVRYVFTTSGNTTYATLYSGSTTRTTTIVRDGSNQVVQMIDPDGSTVNFGWTNGLMTQRTDRRGYATNYTYDVGRRLTGHSLASGATYAQTFRPAETIGLPGTAYGAAQPLDSAYTMIDGPRSDVADITKVWPSKYGPPVRVRSADGRDTRVTYDVAWPGQVATVTAPTGVVSQAWYNARGLPYQTTVSNLRAIGDAPATTQVTWDPRFAKPTSIIGPTGEVTGYGYNPDGTVSWARTGNDPAGNAYAFYTPTGQYSYSTVPGRSEVDAVVYDPVLGNPGRIMDRRGNWTSTTRDDLGRPWLDSAQVSAGVWRTTTTTYDASGRDSMTSTLFPQTSSAGSTIPVQMQYVRSLYNRDGQALEIARWGNPNPTNLDTLKTSFLYDAVGRKSSEWTNATSTDQTFLYDPASNLVQSLDGVVRLKMDYDVMGRLRKRASQRITYRPTSCHAMDPYNGFDCNFVMPLSTAGYAGVAFSGDQPVGAPLRFDGDTALFDYDRGGRQIRADNRHARIRRSYSPGGLLLTDTLQIRTLRYALTGSAVPAVDFTSHVYGLTYTYDASGRRATLQHPTQLAPCYGGCPAQQYFYDGPTGRLRDVTDILGKTFHFTYNVAGQLTDLVYPLSAGTEHTDYDAEGQPVRRAIPSKLGLDSMQYDVAGRLIRGAGDAPQQARTMVVTNWYAGSGALSAMGTDVSGTQKLEEFRYDVLANAYQTTRHGMSLGSSRPNPEIRLTTYDLAGRISRDSAAMPASNQFADIDSYTFDVQGRTQYRFTRTKVDLDNVNDFLEEGHYYDGLGKLAIFERHVGTLQQQSINNDPRALIENYRYDALGRRVLLHTLHPTNCNAMGCESPVQRFVWDGDQMLYETRGPADSARSNSAVEEDAPGGNSAQGSTNAYGVVGYTHAGGIDRPLGALRMNGNVLLAAFYPQTNWRGVYDLAVKDDGTRLANEVAWPGMLAGAYLGATPRSSPYEWFGNLLTEQADASGLMYRRNRYYDPKSGRFTQPDPIGIAGGLNAYGFAGGDPVNYSDPFGLCPERLTGRPCQNVLAFRMDLRTSSSNSHIGEFGMVRENGTRAHQGNDILAPVGSPVFAADEGTVIFAGTNGDHGNQVIIAHKNAAGKTVSNTSYSHLQSLNVSNGSIVESGDGIGMSGKSGNANSPGIPAHLHFEIRTANPVGRGLADRIDPRPEFRNP